MELRNPHGSIRLVKYGAPFISWGHNKNPIEYFRWEAEGLNGWAAHTLWAVLKENDKG